MMLPRKFDLVGAFIASPALALLAKVFPVITSKPFCVLETSITSHSNFDYPYLTLFRMHNMFSNRSQFGLISRAAAFLAKFGSPSEAAGQSIEVIALSLSEALPVELIDELMNVRHHFPTFRSFLTAIAHRGQFFPVALESIVDPLDPSEIDTVIYSKSWSTSSEIQITL
jgi:hypothetical protein